MAYTIPVPESALHALLLQQMPSCVEAPETGFVSGRVAISGRLRKLGARVRFVLEFEPSASGPDEAAKVLDWRVHRVRPLLARWVLKSEFRRRASDAGCGFKHGVVVRVGLDALLEELPAWRRLPASLRTSLRLQHWWMPNDGRGVFLVFARNGRALAPATQRPASGRGSAELPLVTPREEPSPSP